MAQQTTGKHGSTETQKHENAEKTEVKQKDLKNKGKKLKEDMDKLVDKIDETLEENAEEFVKNYVQQGGE